MNKIDLSGRIAVVTGGAQGIGRAITERFLASGASVALWDMDKGLADKTVKQLARSSAGGAVASSAVGGAVASSAVGGAVASSAVGGAVASIEVDVTDWKSVEKARNATLKAFKRVDILVNNAGIAGPNAKSWEYPLEAWRQVMAVNVDGPFHCCRAIVPGMVAHNYGRIVNVASIAGKEGNPNASAYSASKAALIALTKSLAKETAGNDIAVNAITPAAARTAIFDQMTQEHIDFMLSKIPRGRFVKVDEIAALVAWAASAECSFTTGAVLDISGGRATY